MTCTNALLMTLLRSWYSARTSCSIASQKDIQAVRRRLERENQRLSDEREEHLVVAQYSQESRNFGGSKSTVLSTHKKKSKNRRDSDEVMTEDFQLEVVLVHLLPGHLEVPLVRKSSPKP